MKIKIAGDIVTIISNVKFEDLKKATKKEPIYITFEGKRIYGVKVDCIGSITKSGVAFTYSTREGNAALNVCLPEAFNADEAKEYVIDNLGVELDTLSNFEEAINNALDEAASTREALVNSITID